MANASSSQRVATSATGIKTQHTERADINGSDTHETRRAEGQPPSVLLSLPDDDGDDGDDGDAPLTARSAKRQITTLSNGTTANGSPRTHKKLKMTKSERSAMEERLKENATRLRIEADKLPFNEAKDKIVDSILTNDTVIIVADTGSGKSTQLPQLLSTHPTALAYFGHSGSSAVTTSHGAASPSHRQPTMAITQPRRLPCISLAARVSEEMGVQLGREVGYAVRFESKEIQEVPGSTAGPSGRPRKRTNVRFCTEGVLIRELSNGPTWNVGRAHRRATRSDSPLSSVATEQGPSNSATSSSFRLPSDGVQRATDLLLRYDVIVIDEAHERTVNTDMLLGTLKQIQQRRKDYVRRLKAAHAKAHALSNGSSSRKGKEKVPNGVVGDLEEDATVDSRMADASRSTSAETSDNEENLLEMDWGGYPMRELKIIIMSATLNAKRFSTYLDDAPVIFIKGRRYDVKVHHMLDDDERDLEIAALETVATIATKYPPGDILVFMPGQAEIEQLTTLLKHKFNKPIVQKEGEDSKKLLEIHPLFRNMALQDQSKVLQKSTTGRRKVIVSTNIAETSLTIENIAYVVDSGLQKQRNVDFLSSTTITNLRSIPCSQSAARQRTGRAGRTHDGWCFRLYTEDSFKSREAIQKPEIQRAELQSLVLQLVAMGQQPFNFDFIDPPDKDALLQACQALFTYRAVDTKFGLTPIGRRMMHYPVHPARARILIAAFEYGCTSEIIDILAVMEAGDPFAKTSNHEQSDEARRRFLHRDGDHLTSMQVLRGAIKTEADHKADRSKDSLHRWCRDNRLNLRTLQEAIAIREQLRKLVVQDGQPCDTSCGDDTTLVLRSLLWGQHQYTAKITPNGGYKQIMGPTKIKIHPSSTLAGRKVPAFLFDELEITADVYAHNCSVIDESWLLDIQSARHQS